MTILRLRSFIPPVGEPILPRLQNPNADFDWTFGGQYSPIFLDSGTTALRLALEVAARRRRHAGSVWVPAYGCPNIVAACLAAGSTPVLYDVGAGCPFFSAGQDPPADVVAAVTAHFLGLVHPLEDMVSAIRNTDAVLIEDSAQRFPMPGERLYGDAVVLSFGRGKPVSLMGGGCLLIKPHLHTVAIEIAGQYASLDFGMQAQIKCRLHDFAIRPSVYRFVRQLPGLGIGSVAFKSPPTPAALGPRMRELASRAANSYRAETDWTARQESTVALANRLFPALCPIGPAIGQSSRRLLRVPFLGPDAETVHDICSKANFAGLGATRLYQEAQPYIRGVPLRISGSCSQAIAFAARLLTLPAMTSSHFSTTD